MVDSLVQRESVGFITWNIMENLFDHSPIALQVEEKDLVKKSLSSLINHG